MDQIMKLGTPEDSQQRMTGVRVDSANRQSLVQDARQLIFKEGYVVNSKHVEELLKPTSLVPTTVRPADPNHSVCINNNGSEFILHTSFPLWVRCFQDSRCRHPS
jgi:hypothetical protein